ncbi:hypothetical protein V2E09_004099 [Cronobacter malonaticus]
MALDHGMLNVPLNKRVNFHKELDDHQESRKHASRVDRATSLVALRDYREPEVTERKHNPANRKPVNHPNHLINAHQKMRGKSIPAYYD